MLVVGEPTPRPEIPIEGAEMIVPLICIGIFFLIVFGLLVKFFLFMNSDSKEDDAKQDEMYHAVYLRKVAQYHTNTPEFLFPKTYGKQAWTSWQKDLPDAPKEAANESSEKLDEV